MITGSENAHSFPDKIGATALARAQLKKGVIVNGGVTCHFYFLFFQNFQPLPASIIMRMAGPSISIDLSHLHLFFLLPIPSTS